MGVVFVVVVVVVNLCVVVTNCGSVSRRVGNDQIEGVCKLSYTKCKVWGSAGSVVPNPVPRIGCFTAKPV